MRTKQPTAICDFKVLTGSPARIVILFTIATIATVTLSCQKNSAGEVNTGARMLSLDTNITKQIPVGSDSGQLCQYIKDNGYFPGNQYAAGTKILYSTSYEIVRDAAGQAKGYVGADGFFHQTDNVTTQLLLCPGALNGLNGGACLWKINGDDGYAQLAFDVVCNRRARSSGGIHPGYSTMKAAHVSYTASTAGDQVRGADAIEVTLASRESTARILFAKGVGLVATLFQESSMPAGTAEVFIEAQGQ